MSVHLSFIDSLLQAQRDVNFLTLPSQSYYKKFSIKDLVDVFKVKYMCGLNGKKMESQNRGFLELVTI